LRPQASARLSVIRSWPTQIRDITASKIPRALRFGDRISMNWSGSCGEPFLDHRLMELALRQPLRRRLGPKEGPTKLFLREVVRADAAGFARETRRSDPFRLPSVSGCAANSGTGATDMIEVGLRGFGGSFLDSVAVRKEWEQFVGGSGGHSYFAWQWITLGLMESHPSITGR